jgi:hypothetical protein
MKEIFLGVFSIPVQFPALSDSINEFRSDENIPLSTVSFCAIM